MNETPTKPRRLQRLSVNRMIPNILTLLALASGLTGMRFAFQERWELAVMAIGVAAVFDALDGRIARLLKGASKFGAELDSLSDFVCFGVAPAISPYLWAMQDAGRAGWLLVMLFAMCCGLRLARFNVMTDVVDKRYFQGLPSPAAAALVAGFVWLAHDNKIPLTEYGLQWVAAFVALYGGLTMVSSVPFYSFKDVSFRKSVPFWAMLLIVLGFVLVSSDPPIVLFLLFCAYGLSGYVMWALGKRTRPRP